MASDGKDANDSVGKADTRLDSIRESRTSAYQAEMLDVPHIAQVAEPLDCGQRCRRRRLLRLIDVADRHGLVKVGKGTDDSAEKDDTPWRPLYFPLISEDF